MDLYKFVQIVADRADLKISQADKERMVGTLRAAGFRDNLTSRRETEQAVGVVTSVFNRARSKVRTGAAAKQGAELFQAIKDLNDQQLCGKCKNPTETVKLASNEEANYCTTCRVTLWKK